MPCEDAHEQNCELLFKDEVYQIVGCGMEVLNEVGHGWPEKVYEKCLAVEFQLRGIHYSQQERFGIYYKSVPVGEFIPDLISHRSIVIDTKVIECITDHERGKMLNYLRVAKLRVGVILEPIS